MFMPLLIVVTALTLAAALAGCRKDRAASDSDEQSWASPNLNPVGQLPVVKQKESFTLLNDDNGTPEEKIMYPIFEEQTNVHVDLLLFPYQTALERYRILMATGDYPDAVSGWILGDNEVMTMAAEGTIIPLEGLIDKYTVNIKDALTIPGVREGMTLPDDHIYSPPYPIEEPIVTFNPWINQKWLDQLGLSMPATTGEFKQVLIAFRDKIPPVNGQKIIPFSGDPNNLHLGTLAGWFGVNASASGVNTGYFAIIDGQVESTIIRPEYRDFIRYFADLYANALVDPELFTQDNATWKAKGKQGLYGVSIAYGPGDFAQEIRRPDLTPWIKNYDYEALPVLKAPGVSRPVFRRNGFGVSLFRTQFVITDKAKNPATIIRWLDNVYDEQHSIETGRGPIGLKFEKLGDHLYREIDTTNWTQAEKDKYDWGKLWTQSMPKFQRTKAEVTMLPPAGREIDYDYLLPRDQLYEPYLEERPMPQLWMSQADTARVADLQTAVVEYVKQKQAEWISGQASVDAEWDAYIAQLNRLGLQELLRLKRGAVK
jgi:putative aldouronate transport system substrate-binding protein